MAALAQPSQAQTGRTLAARAHCIGLARKRTAPPPLELATQESPESPKNTSTESSGSRSLPAGPVESSTASAVPPLVALPLSSFSSSSRSRLLQIASRAVLSTSESDARLIRQCEKRGAYSSRSRQWRDSLSYLQGTQRRFNPQTEAQTTTARAPSPPRQRPTAAVELAENM